MPLFEFQCVECGHSFEKLQKFNSPDPKWCPLCDGAVRKVLSPATLNFKGSGFYITDYGNKDK